MSINHHLIGFFDSGVGGTTVWREAIKLLPNENTLYLADSKNAPYGNKTKDEIIAYSEKNTEFLLEHNAKLIVVACNTATTNAISHLRDKYRIPFVGIEPAIKPAAMKTRTKSLGILATKGTLSSELFNKTSKIYASGIKVTEQIGEGLVELIENGKANSPEAEALLRKYLKPIQKAHADYLILGCTHYPYLIPLINKITGNTLPVIDTGTAVSQQIKRLLSNNNLLNTSNKKPGHTLYINADSTALITLLQDIKVPYEIIERDF